MVLMRLVKESWGVFSVEIRGDVFWRFSLKARIGKIYAKHCDGGSLNTYQAGRWNITPLPLDRLSGLQKERHEWSCLEQNWCIEAYFQEKGPRCNRQTYLMAVLVYHVGEEATPILWKTKGQFKLEGQKKDKRTSSQKTRQSYHQAL